MNELNIKILTIPRHLFRNIALIGHLETIGVPVIDLLKDGRFTFYDGFDVNDCRDVRVSHVINVGFLKIFEKIVDEDRASLVMTNDCAFNYGFTWDFLLQQYTALINAVGYENIRIAKIFHQKERSAEGVRITDYWLANAGVVGDNASIVTPAGAEFMLQNSNKARFEMFMYDFPKTDGMYAAIEGQARNLGQVLFNKLEPISLEWGMPVMEMIKPVQLDPTGTEMKGILYE